MSKTITRKKMFDFARLDNKLQSHKNAKTSALPLTPPVDGDGLEPYNGEWNVTTAAHLYRRTTFGATREQINAAATLSLDQIIDQLFEPKDLPEEPVNYIYQDIPEIPIGVSWVNVGLVTNDQGTFPDLQQQNNTRRNSLRAWTLGLLLNEGMHIREKMTLFWHNHFVVENQIVKDANVMYKYITLLRENATGNFRDLVKNITIDPAMLVYLNGDENKVNAPNENYARELMELFTLGKGALAGPGDYTTFTEDDVAAAAKVLTGWRVVGYGSRQDGEPYGFYRNAQHDRTDKQFSHRFNNQIISNNGANEYLDLVEMIFTRDEVSKFICRKLYRWFVYYDINEEVEANIIEPLAQILRENDYELEPALKVLLKSTHFFNICSVGPMIKNPLDFVTNLFRQFSVQLPENNIRVKYGAWANLNRAFEALEMVYYSPPNVAGWKAYYQAPLFYRTWINSVTLTNRQRITDLLTEGRLAIGDFRMEIDAVAFIDSLENNQEVNAMIHEIADFIMPLGITEGQKDYVKDFLLPGLPDYEWNMEYDEYLNNPNNEEIRKALNIKLNNMLNILFKMPEFYLS